MTVPTVERGLRLRALLVDRDRRRESVDVVDVRLLHLPQELAGIGGERFDVAALALGVDRVEGQRLLAGAGQPGDDDELVARDLDVDVLEVVLPGPAHADPVVKSHETEILARGAQDVAGLPEQTIAICQCSIRGAHRSGVAIRDEADKLANRESGVKGHDRQNADCRHPVPKVTLTHPAERPLRCELYQSIRTDSSLIPNRLILASGSPRRVALLAELGVPFETVVSNAPESIDFRLGAEAQAVVLAERKARAVASRHETGFVLGADTIVVLDGEMLGKPVDEADAIGCAA